MWNARSSALVPAASFIAVGYTGSGGRGKSGAAVSGEQLGTPQPRFPAVLRAEPRHGRGVVAVGEGGPCRRLQAGARVHVVGAVGLGAQSHLPEARGEDGQSHAAVLVELDGVDGGGERRLPEGDEPAGERPQVVAGGALGTGAQQADV